MKKFLTENVLGALAFAVPMVVYVLTLAPSVTYTDAGELAAVCTSLGIAHPTGYPLFTLLGFAWTKLPLPFTPVFKLNLLSAVCTALATFLFFRVMLRLLKSFNVKTIVSGSGTGDKKKSVKKKVQPEKSNAASVSSPEILILIAFTAALMFAFARTVWQQATAIEVYALHLVMLLLTIELFLRAVQDAEPRLIKFLVWAFVLGLSFSNHLTTVLLAPAMIFLYLKRFGLAPESLKRIAWMAVPFAAGLSLYLYLPLRSAMLPEFDWGGVSRGMDKFLYHATGKQFQVWMFDGKSWPTQLGKFFTLFAYQVAFIGVVPMAFGMWRAWRVDRDLCIFLLLLIAGCVAYSVNYSIHDIDAYFLLAFVAAIGFVAIGLLDVASRKPEWIFLALVLPLISITINYRENDRSQEYKVFDYTANMVSNLDPNAVIISSQWDYFCSAFWYLQHIEGYRRDVVMIEKELLRRTWYLDQLRRWYPDLMKKSAAELDAYARDLELFESGKPYPQTIQGNYEALINSFVLKNLDERPVYLTLEVMQSEQNVAASMRKIPRGFAFQVQRQSDTTAKPSRFSLERFIDSGSETSKHDGHLDEGIRNTATASVLNCAMHAAQTEDRIEAEKLFKLALRLSPDNPTALQGLRQLTAGK
ncbi:MAG: DUF2723 domain-containing protein [Rhizobacter sp.]|nr:DUF2723 domain-containing protein [Chlorobiales bacterium]